MEPTKDGFVVHSMPLRDCSGTSGTLKEGGEARKERERGYDKGGEERNYKGGEEREKRGEERRHMYR